jgi:hypothetical protein
VNNTLEVLAVAGHGAGAVVSMLGIVFHVSKEKTVRDRDVAVHSLCLIYHLNALRKHAKRL